MTLRRIDDISVIVYPEKLGDFGITRRFLSLAGKQYISFGDGKDEEDILSSLRESGIRSKDVLILSDYRGRIMQACPCSKGVVPCGYHVINTCFGCLYDCTYCFLNSYLNSYGISQIVDTDRIIESLSKLKDAGRGIIRIGTGEFTDSLMFDETTGLAGAMIDAVRGNPAVMLEFKTKSDNIDHLIGIREKGSAVLSWSVNTDRIIEKYEKDTSPLEDRIHAAVKAAEANYYTAFHFDPIIDYEGAVEEYRNVIERIFSAVDAASVAWISLGCMRFSGSFREPALELFPDERLTAGELFPSFDGKFRYIKQKRVALYRNMYQTIKRHSDSIPVYLCMEPLDVWNSVLGRAFTSPAEYFNFFHETIKVHLGLDKFI